jgi:hypothetical protein
MNCALEELQARSSSSMLESSRLQKLYLSRMADAVEFGYKLCKIEYPEYTYPDFAGDMQKMVQKNPARAQKRLDAVRPKIESQLKKIETELAGIKDVNSYAASWRRQLASIEYYKAMTASAASHREQNKQKRAVMTDIFKSTVQNNFDKYLENQSRPPKGKVLLEIKPSQSAMNIPEWKDNGWAIGLYKSKKHEAVVVAFDANQTCKKDSSASIITRITIPEHKGRLKFQVFLAHVWDDKNIVPAKYVRASIISVSKAWAFMQDSTNSMDGHEWTTVDAEYSYAGDLKAGDVIDVGFEVYSMKESSKLGSYALFGPIRLIED